jgi:hypothetical protein
MAKQEKSTGRVNKMDAVRKVLATHGKDTMPVEIVKFVKEEHGADMSADMASTYKSAILRKLGQSGRRKGKRKSKYARQSAAAVARTASNGIRIEEIETIKKLCDRIGAEKVRQLAQVLAK